MAKPAVVDKWKLKKVFEVIAPALFKEKLLGEAVANDYNSLVGRTIEKNLSDIIGDPKFQRIKLHFKIIDVKGERALTNYLGHSISQDYGRSLARRRTSKISARQVVELKDSRKVVVKSFAVSLDKINRARKKTIRQKLVQSIDEFAKTEKFEDFINSVLYGKLSEHTKKSLHKVYPVRHVVIQKTEIPQSVASEVKQ